MVQGHVLLPPDISSTQVITKSRLKDDGHTGIFQTVMLGRHVSHEVKDLNFREMQENPHNTERHWKDEERNDKGMPTVHKNHLPDRRDQPSRWDEGRKPIDSQLVKE
ncbi:hypothetical protein MC885_020157 [Smutsia gigantea]|nr:hypothetical protein MC885_020157 [Smutsia gigantea]